ncbi:MAG: PepSY domain-containing protein [Betaproteobacteria bacterium]|nr:PepSY domain-containing protein [Betaproteobacteria bacterium]
MKDRTLKTVRNPRLAFLVVAAAVFGGTVAAHAYTGEQFARDAKVGMAEARSIALRAHPGKIIDAELEKESGGSGLRYSFDIRQGKVTQEVGVDAQTGKVLENAAEGPNPD